MSDFVNSNNNNGDNTSSVTSETPNFVVPDTYYCPISYELMKDPVLDIDGYTVEKKIYEGKFYNC